MADITATRDLFSRALMPGAEGHVIADWIKVNFTDHQISSLYRLLYRAPPIIDFAGDLVAIEEYKRCDVLALCYGQACFEKDKNDIMDQANGSQERARHFFPYFRDSETNDLH